MKTKIKRHSRSVLSIVLTLCMLVSCMTVGIIATDAAKVTDSDEAIGAKADDEAVGAKADDETLGDGDTTYYLWTATSGGGNASDYSCQGAMTNSSGSYTASITITGNGNYYFFINESNETISTGFINYNSLTITKKGNLNNVGPQQLYVGGTPYNSYYTSRTSSSVTSIDLTFDGNTNLTVSAGTGSGGGGGAADEDWYVIGHQFDTTWNTSGTTCKMTKDASTGYFYFEKNFTASNNYYRIHDGSSQYGPADESVITLGTKYSLSTDNSNKSVQISNSLSGNYVVWWDSSNKQTWVVAAAEDTTETVDIYAKDGTLRDGYQVFSEYATTTITAITNPDGTSNSTALAAVKRYNYQDTSKNIDQSLDTHNDSTRYDYAKASGIEVGSTITVNTRLHNYSQWNSGQWNGKKFNDTHYVKAFCINGVAPELYTWKDKTGSNTYTDYSMTYTITEEDVEKDRSGNGYIEITPIYYLKDATNTKTFYIEGYDREDDRYKDLGWGTTLAAYPYYNDKAETENAFGGYPGQPMLFYKGRYEIQIPLTHDGTAAGAKCMGVTLSNNYWDDLHRSLDKHIVNNDTGHRQTYDFDDFYKITEEKDPDQIIFSFKLREKTDNFADGYDRDNFSYADNTEKTLYRDTTTGILYKSDNSTIFSENGIERYKDGLNRDVNLFGTVLNATDAAKEPMLVVSNGYKYTYVGKYATEWVVYKYDGTDTNSGRKKYTYVTQIAPSALVLNNLSSFASYSGGSSTTAATKPKPLGNYQTAYTTLSGSAYTDKPFDICYEMTQYISTDDKANRLDGRWLYTENGDKIRADIKVQYKNSTHSSWTDDTFTTGYDSKANKGATTNAMAYFTNVTPKDLDGEVTATDIPIVPGTYFNFKTVAPTDEDHMNYVFKGWYVSLNGSDPVAIDKVPQLESNLEMTGNAVIIARYEEITSGILTIGHSVGTGTVSGTNYKGTGTAYLKVELLNRADAVKYTFAETSSSQFTTTSFMTSSYASNGYKFRITLRTENANEDNSYGTTTETGSLGSLSGTTPTTASGTVNGAEGKVITIPISAFFSDGTQTITSLLYTSYFTLTEYTYKYVINYKFPTRLYGNEVYKVQSGEITGNKMTAFFDGTKETAKVKKNIITSNTPFETNFNKKLNWDYDTAYSGTISSANNYSVSGQKNIADGTTYTIYVTVIASETDDYSINVLFMLPYQYNSTTKAATSYDVYNGTDTYDTSKDRGSGSDKYELYVNGVREFDNYTDEQLKTTTSKYLMYDETRDSDSPRRVYDNLKATATASTTTQDGESSIVGYDDTVAAVPVEATVGSLVTYDGVVDGKNSHFITAPRYIYVANGDTTNKDQWGHKTYGNVSYHTIRENTRFRTHDVTTNAEYVSYKNTKNGIVASNDYTKKYFSRWDIYSQSDNRYVASCYYYDFNYTSYEDIYVVPVFESDTEYAYISQATAKNNMATVSFLETTRNQWNVNISDGGTDYSNADKVYCDFALTFGDGSTVLNELTASSSKKVRVGMLIERLDGLTGADTTKFATDTDSNVITAASSYVKAFDNNAKDAIANMLINDEGANSATYKSSTQAALYGNAANCKIASNDTWSTRDLTALDNKNRIEYYYGINKLLDSNQYKNYKYAYRAISYILVNEGSGWSAKISDPAYFTIYDTATQTVAG